MNIDKMSTKEKTIALAKLLDWDLVPFTGTFYHDLYYPPNIELAWQVLNWADEDLGGSENRSVFNRWFISNGEDAPVWPAVSASEFIRLNLDKILSLAVEAGMVEVTK